MTAWDLPAPLHGLGAALAIGLLIGLERGWHQRDLSEGARVAGLRTFALTGLLGGVLGSLAPTFGPWPLVAGLVALALLMAVAYLRSAQATGGLSATTSVALLLTLALGAYASSGAIALALAAAVVATVLLNLKPTLHGWLRQIKHRELTAALQLLVLSVVILPYLPNAGFGPYAALNPYALWWAVILIAGLSLAGHFAVRIAGPRRGLLWTGMLGGLASSTAATLALARRARQQPALADAAAMGTLAASAMMFLRMAVLLGAIHPPLLRTYGAALVFTGAAMAGLSLWQWRRLPVPPPDSDEGVAQIPPFDLSTALGFGAFLAAMAVLMPAARDWLGHGGIYGLAAVSGLADVDATAISIARLQAADGLPVAAAVTALGLVTLTNMITKATIAWVTGGARLGRAVASGYALCMLAGALVLALLVMAR